MFDRIHYLVIEELTVDTFTLFACPSGIPSLNDESWIEQNWTFDIAVEDSVVILPASSQG